MGVGVTETEIKAREFQPIDKASKQPKGDKVKVEASVKLQGAVANVSTLKNSLKKKLGSRFRSKLNGLKKKRNKKKAIKLVKA